MSKPTSARARRSAAIVTAAALILTGGLVLAAPAAAAERTFALVGSLQSELGCPGDWQPECAATDLAPTATAGVYAAEFEVPAGSCEYKVAADDAWDEFMGPERRRRQHPPHRRAAPRRCGSSSTTTSTASASRSSRCGRATPPRTTRSSPLPSARPGSQEQFYFVMTDRFANGDAVERHRRHRGRPPRARIRPDRQGLLQRRRHRRPALAARLHRGPRHDGDLAHPELQEPSGAGHRRERQRRLPRLLGDRLHADRPPPRHQRRARGLHRRRARPPDRRVLRHHHEPHGRRRLVPGGQYTYVDQATRPYTDADGTAFDPGRLRRHRLVPGARRRHLLPVHAGRSPPPTRRSRCRRGSTTRRCTTTAATRPGRGSRSPSATSSASTTS